MSEARSIQELFARALRAAPDERERLLAAAPSPAVRGEVEELLAHAERAEHPLDDWTVDSERLRSALNASLGPWPDPPPEAIGDYRVRALLGAGSMSTVFLATGPDGEEVAVKVPKPWLLAGEASRRFEQEIELLGRLDHPFIVRLLDAGRAELASGEHPYLVLERVRGRPLDAWREEDHPTRAERLKLFLGICEGVAHAHQKGVIHRDLKPGNVLVDEAGRPRVVDFGVARATGHDERTASLLTSIGQLVGTLEYMSPEQAAGRPEDVDTRADVYALGVLLFELLTGRRPIDFQGEPLAECLRRIAEREPERLSRYDRTLAGDLETIVGKALEKERARRYSTVRELAADVERSLANLPISARPPSSLYLVGKYARRHPAAASAVGVGVLALVATAVGVLLGWSEARDQAELARARLGEAEAAREESDRVAALLAQVIRAPDASAEGRDALLRDVVLELGDDIEAQLPDQPRGRGRLGFFLALSLSTLDAPARALERCEASVRDLERAGLADSELGEDARRLRGTLLDQLGRSTEACEVLGALVDEQRARHGADDERTLRTQQALGTAFLNRPDLDAAARELEAVLATRTRQHGAEDPRTLETKVAVAGLWLSQGLHDQVLEELSTALPLLRDHHADAPHRLKTPISHLSEALTYRGKVDEALALREEQVAICEAAFGPEQFHTWDARADLVGTLFTMGRFGEGRQIAERTLAWAEEHLDESHAMISDTLMQLATCDMVTDRFEEGEASLREALRRVLLRHPPGHPRVALLRLRLADLAVYDLRPADARDELVALMEDLEPGTAGAPRVLQRARDLLAKSHLMLGDTDEGLRMLHESLAATMAAEGFGEPMTVYSFLDAAVALSVVDLPEEADALLAPFEERLPALAEGSRVHLEALTAVVLQRGMIAASAGWRDRATAALARAEEVGAGLQRPLADDLQQLFELLRAKLSVGR
ncbi:MAG: protein kinase [Planctomycetota bacterium]